jgi:hypothetical protein
MLTGLDSANAKIFRAEEHLNAINRIIRKIASDAGAYKIVEDADGKETVNFLVRPPLTVSILAGEIVYQLRSALDHLAFDLIKFNPEGIILPPKWQENSSFPLWITAPKQSPLDTCFNNILPGVSKVALTFIESLQPYRSGPGYHNAMAIIAKLCNIDKHRHLNPILPRVAVRQDVEYSSGMSSSSIIGGLQHGAEVIPVTMSRGDSDPVVDMKRSFLPYVTFEELSIGYGPATLETQHVLEVCTETVKSVVIPGFIEFLKNPV